MKKRVVDSFMADGVFGIRRISSGARSSFFSKSTNILVFLSFPCFVLISRFFPFDRLPVLCVFRLVTGYPCPTCGLTRSIVAIMHFDLIKAVHMNPFGFLIVGGLAVWWVVSLYEMATGLTTSLHRWMVRYTLHLVLLCLGALGLFGVLRIAWLIKH